MATAHRFQCCLACDADSAPFCSRRCLCHSRDSGQPAFVYFAMLGEQLAAAERFARGERVDVDGFTFETGAVLLRYPGGAEERRPCEVRPMGDRAWSVTLVMESDPEIAHTIACGNPDCELCACADYPPEPS